MIDIYNILLTFKKTRIERKLTTKEIADQLNMTQQNYSRIENGQQKLSLDKFLLICDVLQLDPSSMLLTKDKKYLIFNNNQLEQIEDSLKLLQSEIQKAKTTKSN